MTAASAHVSLAPNTCDSKDHMLHAIRTLLCKYLHTSARDMQPGFKPLRS
jgi:hypothetical protein